MPSSAPAKTVRGSCGCTVRPKTRLSLHNPFMTRRQLSPPSALSHSPLPIVPAQIVYLPDIASSLAVLPQAPDRHSGAPHSGEPGTHIPEAGVHGFRASPFGRSRNDYQTL